MVYVAESLQFRKDRRRRVPDGAGIGSRSDVFIQGFAQRERERVKSVVQAVFTVEPVKKDIPFPSLQFSPSPVETGHNGSVTGALQPAAGRDR